MIIATTNNSVGINFSNISRGKYYSHRVYSNFFTGYTLEVKFTESRLNSSDAIARYKFQFENRLDAEFVIGEYIKQIKNI